jgi:tripartite-type tricarboxylate transporter receptor subunit TctC
MGNVHRNIKLFAPALIAAAILALCVQARAQSWPDPNWQQVDPATAGWSVDMVAKRPRTRKL